MDNGVMPFQFSNEIDLSMVENNGPWRFNMAPHEVTFNVMPI